MTKSGSNFLFIVLKDPFVLGIIDFLQTTIGNASKVQPHITIQGPLSDTVTADRINSVRRVLREDEILLANPSCFEGDHGVVLYMSATSKHMESVWNKPDYPISEFGFNPHITIYEGTDKIRVRSAIKFLKREPIELICRDFDVIPYVSKQVEMFPSDLTHPDNCAFEKLLARGKVGSTFRARFLAAVNSTPTRSG
jgi:hypothetical protein